MSLKVNTNLNQGQIKFKTGEVLNEDTIIHRLLFSLTDANCGTVKKATLRLWKWQYKSGIFPQSTKHKILIASGFVIEKKAEWKYVL